MGSLDPLGRPLSTDVLSGERADDGLYIPIIDRIRRGLPQSGLLFVGDCKMSALETRAHIVGHQPLYLSPLPLTGATAEAMATWITAGVVPGEASALERVFRPNDRGPEVRAAAGYEVERTCGVPGRTAAWTERVLVLRSPMHAQQQAAGLETRLSHAEQKLATLTPPRGRGKRQITDEAPLVTAIDPIRTDQRVHGLLSVAWEQQSERKPQYVGRGRGAASRGTRVVETVRDHITHIARQEDPLTALTQRFGWKAFVTKAVSTRLSLQEAVLGYRNAYRVERLFNRLKSRGHIAPLFVKRHEHIEGLTYLLTLGVRV